MSHVSSRIARPNLEHLKNQARALLRRLAADPATAARFSAQGITSTNPKFSDALHVIARDYGFDTWTALKLHLAVAAEDPLEALSAAIIGNDASLVRDVLARHPRLKSTINEPLPNHPAARALSPRELPPFLWAR